MQKIFNELRLESGLLTRAANKGVKIESNAGIRFNQINTNALGNNSCCFGYGGTASGYFSTHFGYGGTASGYSSVHFGYGGTASGYYSTHFGASGTASGYNSTHFGYSGTASGYNSTHFGYNGTASGYNSTHFGASGTASGYFSTHFGYIGTASGYFSTHFGYNGTASGYNSTHFGYNGTASGYNSTHFGKQGVMSRYGQMGFSAGKFLSNGDCQRSTVLMRGATTGATPLVLAAPENFFIEDEKAYALDIDIMARQDTGASHLFFKRQVMIERTGGTTALVGSVQTVGVDINAGSLGGVAITADNTNDRLQIEVTGKVSANIRWSADITIREIGYAD